MSSWRNNGKQWLHCLACAVALLALPLRAQNPVAPCTDWLCTVEEASQQICLTWRPSADPAAMGYHICSGSPCTDYDTVFGRLDTTYRCLDHLATDPHTYRLHVFDTARNVSALTPHFGNMVLTADIPLCAPTLAATWTPYTGMPGGLAGYELWARLEPFDTTYNLLYSTDSAGPLAYSTEMPDPVTRVWLKVQAVGRNGLRSQSNVATLQRPTADSAAFVEIASAEYDSLRNLVRLAFRTDTAYHHGTYSLFRSVDGGPEVLLDSFGQAPASYTDEGINVYDSLHCYRLAVTDGCGLNPKRSPAACVVVPEPPEPSIYFPNAILAGHPTNGVFRPVARGLMGDLYDLYIYTRQGMLLYHTSDPVSGWTPTADTPQGVYTYFLRCRFNSNFIKTYSGTLLVVK